MQFPVWNHSDQSLGPRYFGDIKVLSEVVKMPVELFYPLLVCFHSLVFYSFILLKRNTLLNV